MSLNLTRKQLYDLVWAKPRCEIAKQFQISDVRLGKLCREMNVPAPPRGYWASVTARLRKRKYLKPPLTYTVAERIEEDHAEAWASFPDFDPKKLDQPIPPPPTIPAGVAETLVRYKLLVDRVATPKVTRGLHPITQKFVTEDERLAKLARQYSWERPKFDSPVGKQLLQGLNQLLWMWTDLGFKPRASGYRNISMRIGHGDFGRSFEVSHTSQEETRGRYPAKRGLTGFEFWFDTQTWERQSKKPALVFPAFSRAVLRSLALLVIEHWEAGFRASVKRNYDWKVSERNEAIEQAELVRKRERQRQAAELQAVQDSRQKLLHEAVTGAASSDQLRLLIRALDERLAPHTKAVPAFEHWRSWALVQAEIIDPRTKSLAQLNEWFEEFRLDQ